MLEFIKEDNRVVLSYTGEQVGSAWIYREIEEKGYVTLRKTFWLTEEELLSESVIDDEDSPVLFRVASKDGEYYRFPNKIFRVDHDIYIHVDVDLTSKSFIAERNISIFSSICRVVEGAVYIGGQKENAIPESGFYELLQKFPNSYELTKYARARVGAVISSYLELREDYEEKYQKYMSKKVSVQGEDLRKLVANAEFAKYEALTRKLETMLTDESSYSEKQWQEEILQIILLLYPKYIHVFKEAQVRDTYNNKNRSIDLLLVDATGNIDIIEIKKPFDKCIVTHKTYRDNYIPLRELSGTVMQIEKYIFYLNKWGKRGEETLTSRYSGEMAEGFTIKVTNPGAIIIMGRENSLSGEQLQDFEVIKRKYKHVIDIITYDDLLRRLNRMLTHWSKIT